MKRAPKRGRPTDDPKTELVAARLPERHIRFIKRRAKLERVSFSEALRRFLEEAMTPLKKPKSRQPRAKR